MKKKHHDTPEHAANTPNGAPAVDSAGDAASAPAPSGAPVDADSELHRLRAREDELLRALAELQNVNRRRKLEAETALL